MTVDDLFRKIGVLTMEADMLREENGALRLEIVKVTKERDELQAVSSANESDIEKSDEETTD